MKLITLLGSIDKGRMFFINILVVLFLIYFNRKEKTLAIRILLFSGIASLLLLFVQEYFIHDSSLNQSRSAMNFNLMFFLKYLILSFNAVGLCLLIANTFNLHIKLIQQKLLNRVGLVILFSWLSVGLFNIFYLAYKYCINSTKNKLTESLLILSLFLYCLMYYCWVSLGISESSNYDGQDNSFWLFELSLIVFYIIYMVLMFRQARIQDIRDYGFVLYLKLFFLNIYYLEYKSKYPEDSTIADGKDPARVGIDS